MRYVVDTNIWIRLLRKENSAGAAMHRALNDGHQIIVPSMVYFELLRGLEKRGDSKSMAFFRGMLDSEGCVYAECSRPIWDLAIDFWVSACRQRKPREDADILIAAFARHHGATVVTENTGHFSHLGVRIENWSEAPDPGNWPPGPGEIPGGPTGVPL